MKAPLLVAQPDKSAIAVSVRMRIICYRQSFCVWPAGRRIISSQINWLLATLSSLTVLSSVIYVSSLLFINYCMILYSVLFCCNTFCFEWLVIIWIASLDSAMLHFRMMFVDSFRCFTRTVTGLDGTGLTQNQLLWLFLHLTHLQMKRELPWWVRVDALCWNRLIIQNINKTRTFFQKSW